ncbi:MAG TPA: glutaminyl-peptide cyclotransferase [Saprospiraceae bacterium]|nr:glutaminyl-peptide cyclotransferase [Saprospiraceae bacterium]
MKNFNIYAIVCIVMLGLNCNNNNNPKKLKFTIIQEYPHDAQSFTQGLVWENNILYESTGLENKSRLLKVDLITGQAYDTIHMDDHIFAEGICVLDSFIYQLTWQNHLVFVYRKSNLELIKTFNIATEGWGICSDGQNLWVSDGTNTLYYYNPNDLALIKKIYVKNKNVMISQLNELEYVDGYIYANQWNRNDIYKIDPKDGKVVGILNLFDLKNKAETKYSNIDVLNGIAFNSESKTFYITGKFWPILFELKIE